MAGIQGIVTLNEVQLLEVDAPPAAGAGTPAPVGSLATIDTGAGFYLKTSAADTAWSFIGGGGGGTGVTPPFTFSKAGNAGPGTYLRTGEAVTSSTGQPIKGLNYLVEMRCTNGSNVGAVTRVQLQRRTAVSTFVDITGAFVDIPIGQFQGESTGLSIVIGPEWEVSAYVVSGSTLNNPVLIFYLVPQ